MPDWLVNFLLWGFVALFVLAIGALVIFVLGMWVVIIYGSWSDRKARNLPANTPTVNWEEFLATVNKLTLTEAREKAYALLNDGQGFTIASIDPASMASAHGRVPPAMFDIWSRYGSVDAEESLYIVAPDEMAPAQEWCHNVLPKGFLWHGDVVEFSSTDGHSCLFASPHEETLYEVADDAYDEDSSPTKHISFYHWICACDPNPPARDPTLLLPAT